MTPVDVFQVVVRLVDIGHDPAEVFCSARVKKMCLVPSAQIPPGLAEGINKPLESEGPSMVDLSATPKDVFALATGRGY